ncbi:MAG: protease inhibitor I42 family protein [Victivallales bacterium]|nr:protease inhibitor I42 family protein [Victivallales bacterium]
MKKLALSFGVAGLLGLFGCASQEQPSEVLHFPEPSQKLTIRETGKSFSLEEGQYAQLSLKENPSTGYSWFFKLDDGKSANNSRTDSAIKIVGERLLPPQSDLAGAPTVREVMIKALRPGTATLIGECVRPWEKDKEPAISVRYDFRVSLKTILK